MKGLALKLLLISLGSAVPAWAVYHYILSPTIHPASISKASPPQTSTIASLPPVLPRQAPTISTVISLSSPKGGMVALRKENFSKVEKTDSSREITAERRDFSSPPPPFSMGPALQGSSSGQFFPSPSFGGTVPQNSPLGIPRAVGEIPSAPFSPPSTITSPSPSPVASSSPQTGIPGSAGPGALTSPLISKTGGNNSSSSSGLQGNQNGFSPPSPSPPVDGPPRGGGSTSSDSPKNSNPSDNGPSTKQVAFAASSDGQTGSGSTAREKKSERSNQSSGTGGQQNTTNGDGSGGGSSSSTGSGQNPASGASSGSGTTTGGNSTGSNVQPQSLRTGGAGSGSGSGVHAMALMASLGDPTEPTYPTNDNSSSTEVASNSGGSTDSPGGFGKQDHGENVDSTVHAHVSVAPPGQTTCGDLFTGGVPTVKVTYSPDGQTNQFSTNKWGNVGVDLNKPIDQWSSAQFSVSFTDGNGTLYSGRLSPTDGTLYSVRLSPTERTKTVSNNEVDPAFCFYLVSMPNLKKVVTGVAADATTQDQEAAHFIPRN